jgi:DNA-binding NarL/FixJ family response regulator
MQKCFVWNIDATNEVASMEIARVLELRTSFISIFLVDDYKPWLQFLQDRINQEPEMRVIGQAFDGLEAVQKAEELQPDIILLDIGLPMLNGIQAAVQIKKVAAKSAILFVSESSDQDLVRAALTAGGNGYILKSKVVEDLRAGIEALLVGQRFISPELMDRDEGL